MLKKEKGESSEVQTEKPKKREKKKSGRRSRAEENRGMEARAEA